MAIKTNCLATAVGSFPHSDIGRVLDIIFDTLPDAPLWPQLPRSGFNEQMEIQYSAGMPRSVIDLARGRLYFDTSGDYSEEFASFYEYYMSAMDGKGDSGDFSAMAISPDFSMGLYAFADELRARGERYPFIKCQTTGPCSFALTICDENKRAIYYNEEFRDVIVKALALKCRWQIRKFQPYAERIMCFIDEPILSAFGSSTYVAVKREDVVSLIGEVVGAVRAENALAGVHCCGNTDWTLLTDAGVDLINLDAFSHGESLALYPEAVGEFIARGGLIAWGVVPTSLAIREQTVDSLAARLAALIGNLSAKANVDGRVILEQSLVTPSCGAGSLSEGDADLVFDLLKDLCTHVRNSRRF